MENENSIDAVILSSSYYDDKNILKENKEKIIGFINKYIAKDKSITIGRTKNTKLIEFLEGNNFNIEVKEQPPRSLIQSNKKSITESNIVLFLYHDSSTNLKKFIEYTQNLDNKEFYILKLV